MTLLIAVLVVAVVLVVLALRGRGRTSRAAPLEEQASQRLSLRGALPDSLPVAVKGSFFSRSELAFFGTLSAVLEGTPYTVFPNVRLNDLFTITDREQRQSTYNRLRDKHVDFLIVSRDGFRPVLAVELDGASHEQEVQQKRDAVKNLVFRSAGLALLRLDARQPHPAPVLKARLALHLPGLTGRPPEPAPSR